MKIIEAEGINKFFGAGQNRVHVLKDMSFSIEEGDFVAIIGQSGSGKSTLMNILGCLDTQSSGVCRIGGVDIGMGRAHGRQGDVRTGAPEGWAQERRYRPAGMSATGPMFLHASFCPAKAAGIWRGVLLRALFSGRFRRGRP